MESYSPPYGRSTGATKLGEERLGGSGTGLVSAVTQFLIPEIIS
jgi:hypothetical protein